MLRICTLGLISLSLYAQTRIIPHLTRAGGGFQTQIILENTTDATQPYQFHAFDASGNPVGIVSGIHQPKSISNLSPDGLFGVNSDVSHFTIEASSGITVAVAYSAASGPGSPAHIRESSVQAKTWRVYAGNWDLIFDGFAAINLGSAATDVSVAQIDANGNDLQVKSARTGLAPNAKTLYVLGDAFQPMDNVYYEIRATQPISVTSLRGTAPSADVGYLWENSAAQFEAVTSTGSLAFPFWETVNTGPEAFRLTQDGSGMAARFEINNPSSSNDAMYVTHNGSGNVLNATQWGSGRAALIRQNNTTTIQPALDVDNKGQGAGIRSTSSGDGDGAYFAADNTSGSAAAMRAVTNGGGDAGFFAQLSDTNQSGAGVYAVSMNQGPAILAQQQGSGQAGRFEVVEASNSSVALVAENYGLNAAGWFHIGNANNTAAALWAGTDNTAGGMAAYFSGNVHVSGTLSKSQGSFKIDHPLDPANKYLSHSFVESPDMMNVYNGNVVLDEEGSAWVDLPEYFGVLNRDFRYQLTPFGAAAALYVAQEVSDNRFKISGGQPGMKVSWQVTGVRDDAYARAHRIQVESDKPVHEKGTYLNPDVFAQVNH